MCTLLSQGDDLMHVGAMTVELLIADSSSLKDKRRHLKSIIERMKSRFNVSIAEVDHQDL